MKLRMVRLYKGISFNKLLHTQFQVGRPEFPGLDIEVLANGLVRIKTNDDSVVIGSANIEYGREIETAPTVEEKSKKSSKP